MYLFSIPLFVPYSLLVLAKQLESVTWLEWTGRRSIVYYFFSGGIPLIVSSLLQRIGMGYSGEYLIVFLLLSFLSMPLLPL